MIKIKRMKVKKKKPQGKLNEDIIFQGIINGEKLKDIAPKAGSLAKTDDDRTLTVSRKVSSSVNLQARLAAHRQEQLRLHSALSREIAARIIEKNDINKIGSGEAIKALISNGGLIQNLTKQEKTPENPNSSANPVNLAIEKLAKVAESALNKINNPFTKEAIEIKPEKEEKEN